MEIYVVTAGDTLLSIAQKFGTSVEAIQQLNQFPNPEQLVVGQAILIPAPAFIPLKYTVVRGDTLYLIAQAYSSTVDAIVQANNITNPNLINVGTVLIIPGWSSVAYTVQSGDTLYKIATKFGVTVGLISKTNNITNPSLIYPGQILIIPQKTVVPIQKEIETLAYFQLYNMNGLERSLAQIGKYITYGALFQYPVTPGGNITISANTTRAVEILKRFNVKPFPVITNWTANVGFDSDLARTILGNETVKQQTIASTLSLLDQFGFAGVNVDFENMYPEDRALYTAFIRDLSAALKPRGYLVTLAVAPKARDYPTAAWVGAFDYAALGAIADFIFIMTYEWGWVGGPPMAIAPLPQVRQVIEYAVTQMPAIKIVQGVPLYGYNWPLPDTPQTQASAINLVDVYNLAYQHGATINYDATAQSPWFRYMDEQGAEHEVWFEDARSVQAKYQLAREFGLRGVGYWSYLNEPYGFTQNWPVLQEIFKVVKYT